MKSLDDMPYTLVVNFVAVPIFTASAVFVYGFAWEAVAAMILGAILGYAAAASTLKERKLPLRSTLRDMKLSQTHERQLATVDPGDRS